MHIHRFSSCALSGTGKVSGRCGKSEDIVFVVGLFGNLFTYSLTMHSLTRMICFEVESFLFGLFTLCMMVSTIRSAFVLAVVSFTFSIG